MDLPLVSSSGTHCLEPTKGLPQLPALALYNLMTRLIYFLALKVYSTIISEISKFVRVLLKSDNELEGDIKNLSCDKKLLQDFSASGHSGLQKHSHGESSFAREEFFHHISFFPSHQDPQYFLTPYHVRSIEQ